LQTERDLPGARPQGSSLESGDERGHVGSDEIDDVQAEGLLSRRAHRPPYRPLGPLSVATEALGQRACVGSGVIGGLLGEDLPGEPDRMGGAGIGSGAMAATGQPRRMMAPAEAARLPGGPTQQTTGTFAFPIA